MVIVIGLGNTGTVGRERRNGSRVDIYSAAIVWLFGGRLGRAIWNKNHGTIAWNDELEPNTGSAGDQARADSNTKADKLLQGCSTFSKATGRPGLIGVFGAVRFWFRTVRSIHSASALCRSRELENFVHDDPLQAGADWKQGHGTGFDIAYRRLRRKKVGCVEPLFMGVEH